MSTRVKIGVAIVVFIGVFALTWAFYYPRSPLGKQMANLRLAAKHLPKVVTSLRRLNGADRVIVGVNTGLEGSLGVHGNVADEQTAEAVISAVLASSPPVTVQFHLTVGETNIITKVVELGAVANSPPPQRAQ